MKFTRRLPLLIATALLLLPSGGAQSETTCLTDFSFAALTERMGLTLIATGQTEERRNTFTVDWYASAAGHWLTVYTNPGLALNCIVAQGTRFHLYTARSLGICRNEEACSPA